MTRDLQVSPQPFTAEHGTQIATSPEAFAIHRYGDGEVVRSWASIFDRRSLETGRHYRSQIGKLRLFLRMTHPDWEPNTLLQLALEEDIGKYEDWLREDPDDRPKVEFPEEELERFGLEKQPFTVMLKDSSVNQAMTVVHALFEYLTKPNEQTGAPYRRSNPASRQRRSNNRVITQTDRHISLPGIQAMRQLLLDRIEQAQAVQTGASSQLVLRNERTLWMFTLLFGLWGRREELTKLVAGDFAINGDGHCKVRLKRKGGKIQEVIVAGWVIQGMRRYRKSIGLLQHWEDNDPTPAIQSLRLIKGQPGMENICPMTLYLEIRQLAKDTAVEIEECRLLPDHSETERAYLVKKLKACSPHWFRHSGPTIAINSGVMSLDNASDLLGHKSRDTTKNMYLHSDDKIMRAGLDQLGEQLLNPI